MTKRKVGKSCVNCDLSKCGTNVLCPYKFKCHEEKMRYWKPRQEVKKSCDSCFDKYYKVLKIQVNDPASKIDPYMRGMANGLILGYCMITGREPHYIEKPKQEVNWIEIAYYLPSDTFRIINANVNLHSIIPKGSTLKFKLIKAEGKILKTLDNTIKV